MCSVQGKALVWFLWTVNELSKFWTVNVSKNSHTNNVILNHDVLVAKRQKWLQNLQNDMMIVEDYQRQA